MMQTEPPPPPAHVLSSPSFSSYSSETFAQIAARVIHELQYDPLYQNDDDDTLFDPWPQNDNHHDHHPNLNDNNDDDDHDHDHDHDDDEDFEFSFVSRDPNSSPVSADDVFHNGQIRPTYPLFGRDIVPVSVTSADAETATVVRRRLPLRALMFEERETTSCSSSSRDSSTGNELEGVEAGTYCVWTPQACKKSSSTGSSSSWSRRWKLRDLLLRSHSADGKVAPRRSGSTAKDGTGVLNIKSLIYHNSIV